MTGWWESLRRPGPLVARVVLVAAGGLLWAAPSALAASTTSVNWAGYAAHRAGVRFRSVSAEWRVPTPACTAGSPGYSSVWVGLGGYSASSDALEQTGVEVDCSQSGRAEFSAWYELVPAAPRTISVDVRPGDLMHASVSVSGRRVTIVLTDLTHNGAFRRSFHPSAIDATSADWIVEAPSECSASGQCLTLPLADFGRASVFAARATTAAGHAGTIASRWWSSTAITLVPHGSRSFADTAAQPAQAVPSALTAAGSAFDVTYQASSQPGASSTSPGPFFGARADGRATGHLVHPQKRYTLRSLTTVIQRSQLSLAGVADAYSRPQTKETTCLL